ARIRSQTVGRAIPRALEEARLVTVDGKKYMVKAGMSEEHIVAEMAADSVYRAAGINVPDTCKKNCT
ncbi:MAG: hypothetical protein IKW38_06785, partial [Kiritimatiellae bacterium]|nr:hypothetical protein [Kiritimatiellia bacterium]